MYESTSAECPDVNRLAVRMWSAYAKDKKQELINKFLSDNLNKDYEVAVIDLNNDSIQNKISVTKNNLNNTVENV